MVVTAVRGHCEGHRYLWIKHSARGLGPGRIGGGLKIGTSQESESIDARFELVGTQRGHSAVVVSGAFGDVVGVNIFENNSDAACRLAKRGVENMGSDLAHGEFKASLGLYSGGVEERRRDQNLALPMTCFVGLVWIAKDRLQS